MYATLTDLIADLFGIHIPMGIQTFGLLLAVSFLLAGKVLQLEFQRKENLGLLKPGKKIISKNTPVTPLDYILNGIGGFVLGYKLLYILLHYSSCAADPQHVLFSGEGNFWGGLALGGFMLYQKYSEQAKLKGVKEEKVEVPEYPHELTGTILLVAAVSGIIGAKVFDYLENPSNLSELFNDPGSVLFSGLTMYGGLVFGFIAVTYYCRKKGINLLHLVDATAPALMLAYGVGRIGCHLAGDGDWGIDNLAPKPQWMSFLPDWLWSFRYAHNVNNDGIPIEGCAGPHCFILENPVFPTPLYEAIICISLFFVLWALRKRIQTPGVMFSLYLMLNGFERFWIEKIRINSTYQIFGHHITQAEIIATILFVLGLVGVFYFSKNKEKASTPLI